MEHGPSVVSRGPPTGGPHPTIQGRPPMASNGKKKTTMAKINRENKMRERRMEKQARKDARKREAAQAPAAVTDPMDVRPNEDGVPLED